jgi:hypothetical protein
MCFHAGPKRDAAFCALYGPRCVVIESRAMIADLDTQFFSDVFAMLLVVAVAIIIICWIVFPIIVLRRMKELCAVQREIVKALQWMVDNWRKD